MITETTHRQRAEQRVPYNADEALDLIWGAKAIAAAIGKTPRATFHMLEQGQIPSRKIGNQWVASRKVLRDHFEQGAK